MKTKLYYHIFLPEDHGSWAYPFMEQFKLMEDVGLTFDDTLITCISPSDKHTNLFHELASTFFKSGQIHIYMEPHANNNQIPGVFNFSAYSENLTMQKIWNDCQNEDMKLLYLHAKGVTATDRCLNLTRDVNTFKNYYYWRQFLNWGVIEKADVCKHLLDNHDIVGVNYFDEPAPHFSGAFWWANASHIRNLPDPSKKEWWYELQNKTQDQWLKTAPERFRDEMWPCSIPCNKYSIHSLPKVTNLSAELIRRNEYA